MYRLFLLAILFLTSCSESSNQDLGVSEPDRPEPQTLSSDQSFHIADVPKKAHERIRTETAIERLTPHIVTAPGHVAVDLTQVAKVSSRIPGQIERVLGKLGDQVAQGQPLATIESLMLDELIQEYLVAKAKGDVAKTNFKRTQQLLDENIVSKRRFFEDRGRYLEAQAVYQHVREKLLNMGLTPKELHQLEHGSHLEGHQYILRAPLSGTIVDQQVVLGQGVTSGEELFEIVDTSRVWIFANLPIEQARRFTEGDQGKVIPRGGTPIMTRLTYIAPVAEGTTRTVRVRFDVDNTHGRLKPNEYVEVQLVDEQRPMLSIPNTAVTMVDGKRGVFIQKETGYEFVFVDIGHEGGGFVEITRGMKVGNQVVTKGVFDLKNAMLEGSIEGH
ncbi:MAG: PTS cellobiose transporter subunit IIB [Nitrospirales bacterium]|nr:MAG: PTS cellobiose transporter subunit IIB [Nitrospirales bacterium]